MWIPHIPTASTWVSDMDLREIGTSISGLSTQPQRQPDLKLWPHCFRVSRTIRPSRNPSDQGRLGGKTGIRESVNGLDVYNAVLDAGVSDVQGFESWLRCK